MWIIVLVHCNKPVPVFACLIRICIIFIELKAASKKRLDLALQYDCPGRVTGTR